MIRQAFRMSVHPGQHAEYERVGNTEEGEPDTAENADEDAGEKLRPHIGRERGVQLLEQLMPAQLATVWEGSDQGPPQGGRIFQ